MILSMAFAVIETEVLFLKVDVKSHLYHPKIKKLQACFRVELLYRNLLNVLFLLNW